MGRVIHFEIHADDPQRAVAFYREVFGWEIQSWGGPIEYWLCTTGPEGTPGINGAILRRNQAVSGTGVTAFVCTIDVADLDDTLAEALRLGATLAVPKQPVPGIGWVAYIADPEGNLLAMMQTDPNARPG